MIVSPGKNMMDGLHVKRHLAALFNTEPGLPYSIRYLFTYSVGKGEGEDDCIDKRLSIFVSYSSWMPKIVIIKYVYLRIQIKNIVQNSIHFGSFIPFDWHCMIASSLFYSKSDLLPAHDDVIKWKHFLRYRTFVRGIHRPPVNSPHKGQWHGALTFSLICAWINGSVNNHEAGDLRRHRTHYYAIVMNSYCWYQYRILFLQWDSIIFCSAV